MNRKRIGLLARVAITILCAALLAQVAIAQDETQNQLSLGERFHQETAVTIEGIVADRNTPRPTAPEQFKTYPDAKRVTLPDPAHRGVSLEEALEQRRSVRSYSEEPLSLTDLSQLLWAAQGVTGDMGGRLLRTAPSAGALYPYEIYLVVMNVEGLEPGIYHYAVRDHELELVKADDLRKELSEAALGQRVMGNADVVFVLAAVFDRTRAKYGERGFRYVYMEAGHISQNIYLQAISLGLASVAVGAFYDGAVNDLVGIDGDKESTIYLHAAGTK